ncbi:hypothetical protein FRZ61_50090 [Hypericibacter adhaerens]|jgi:hypothetical protein|uniref:DUF2000 domain-containing protein n=1 Tax=Hypericibacter adhaerens TaxID=2602016 RepID=A0A5J6N6D5_9PROT|nr:DUF2000 family protein [Hypericibacter adhaerens]QEX25064.1 hypothetical protein FRZ61_50090 [Hypericibacter adhaerens]
MSMTFDTKIAVVLRDDLPVWQKLNVTAFTVSGIAAKVADVTGEPYEDGSGNRYLPMFKQPVLVFAGDAASIRRAYERARERNLEFSLFTEELFATGNDIDNRAAMKAVPEADLRIVGLALRAEKKTVDKVLKGLSLHR